MLATAVGLSTRPTPCRFAVGPESAPPIVNHPPVRSPPILWNARRQPGLEATDIHHLKEPLPHAKYGRRQVDVSGFDALDEFGPDAGRAETSNDSAALDTRLLEDEDVRHDDDIAFHALHFSDVHHFPGTVLHPLLMDDQVNG